MIKFKDFVTTYISNLHQSYTPEPLEIHFGENGRFLFAVDYYSGNMKDLEKFVSKKVLESYVYKFWLDKEKGRIGVTLTSKMEN